MRRMLCILIALLLVLPATVLAAETPVTASSTGYENVLFSNGYRGFCLDNGLDGAYTGDTFTATGDTTLALQNTTEADISQKLKILFAHCFEDIFVSDGNGGYVISNTNLIQKMVWHYTDNFYIYYNGSTPDSLLLRAIEEYTGPAIPDNGYTKTLSNGDRIAFSFMVMAPQREQQQHFFAYYFTVTPAGSHTHSFGTDWETDGSEHWHECDCGEKSDVTPHTPTVINDKPAAEFEEGYTGDTVCSVCNELMETGETIPATHVHNFGTYWETDGFEHWYECDCGEKSDVTPHTSTVINAKPATETEEGYTGDTVCSVCNELLEAGEPIDKLPSEDGSDEGGEGGEGHSHSIPENWSSDEAQHWKECPCGEKIQLADHEKTVINQKPSSTTEEGYTGDTVCSVCEKLIEKGQAIPKNHQHDFGTTWKTSTTQHWKECPCGAKQDTADHVYKDGYCTTCNYYNPNYTSENPNTGDSFVPAHHIALCLMSLASIAWICGFAKKKGIF